MASLPADVRGMPRIYVSPGDVVVTRDPVILQTTLGSCVSITLRDATTGLAAMCHAAMPVAPAADRSWRFVDRAVDELLARFTSEGIPPGRVSAKVLGGARRLGSVVRNPLYGPVGPRNVDAALACLAHHRLRVEALDTGGEYGRRVLFVVSTGEVYVRQLGVFAGGGGR